MKMYWTEKEDEILKKYVETENETYFRILKPKLKKIVESITYKYYHQAAQDADEMKSRIWESIIKAIKNENIKDYTKSYSYLSIIARNEIKQRHKERNHEYKDSKHAVTQNTVYLEDITQVDVADETEEEEDVYEYEHLIKEIIRQIEKKIEFEVEIHNKIFLQYFKNYAIISNYIINYKEFIKDSSIFFEYSVNKIQKVYREMGIQLTILK